MEIEKNAQEMGQAKMEIEKKEMAVYWKRNKKAEKGEEKGQKGKGLRLRNKWKSDIL